MLFGLGKKHEKSEDFEALVEQHLDSLYGAALRYTRNPAQAEDLVQDTVVRALRFRHTFQMGTNFRAWVHTILTHTFIHKYRRQKREREILTGHSKLDVQNELRSEAAALAVEQPEQAYLENMLSDDVLAALDSIPEDFRTVVVLCDIQGLSYKEIADAVQVPVGTVMSRLYRGRRLLEGKLAALAIERGIIKPSLVAAKGERQSDVDEDAVLDLSQYRRRRHG